MWKLLLLLVATCIVSASQAGTSNASAGSSSSSDSSGTSATAVSAASATNNNPSNSNPSNNPPPSSGSGNPSNNPPPSNGSGSPSNNTSPSNGGGSGQGSDSSDCECAEALEQFRQALIAHTAQVVNAELPLGGDGINITSPLGALNVLAILQLAAIGKTQAEIMNVTDIEVKDILCVVKAVLQMFTNQPEEFTYLFSAIKVADYKYNFTDQIKNEVSTLSPTLHAMNADFNQISKLKKQINNIISSDTKGYVNGAVYQLNKNGLNVIAGQYFAAPYDNPFNTNNITSDTYYGSCNNTCNVNYFYQRGVYDYAYCEDLDAELIRIPFVDDYMEALYMLPSDKDGCPALAQKLASNPDLFQTAYDSMSPTKLALYLPVYGNQTRYVNSRQITMMATNIKTLFNKGQFKNLIVGDIPIGDKVFTQKIVFNNIYDSSDNSMDCGCSDDDSDDSDAEYCEVIADHCAIIYIIRAGFPLFAVYGNVPCVS